MKLSCIIACAGSGERLKSGIPKPLVLLRNTPLFLITLRKITGISYIREVVLVVNENLLDEIEGMLKRNDDDAGCKVSAVVPGGDSRTESVFMGLKETPPDCEYVMIHDCARPFFTQGLVEKMMDVLQCDSELDGVIPGVALKSTLKQVKQNDMVSNTLERFSMRLIQTPQIVKRQELIQAYENIPRGDYGNFTDDSQLLEKNGCRIKIIEGEEDNIKITTPSDLKLAEFLIEKHPVP